MSYEPTVEPAHQAQAEQSPATSADQTAPASEQAQSDAAYGSESEREQPIVSPWYCDIKLGDMALVFFTACLVIVGAATIESGERVAGRSMLISHRQMRIAGAQVDIMRKQHALGRQQHLAEYRPRLRVRHVMLGTPQVPLRLPNVDTDVQGGLVVVNVGGTKAKIIDSRYLIYFAKSFDGLPMHSPLDDNWTELFVPDAPPLEIGESRALPINGTVWIGHGQPQGTFIQFGRNEWSVYVMGQIQYQDDGGNDRFMGFCRQWAGEGTFRAVSDPDYEYED